MPRPDEIYDLLLDCAIGQAPVEEVLIGQVWTLCQAQGIGLTMTPPSYTRTLPWPGTLAGRPAAGLAGWIRAWDPFKSAVGMAAINAVINAGAGQLLQQGVMALGPRANLAVFEHFLPRLRRRRVAVVGRYPGLERYAAECELSVIERRPGAGDLPDPASEFILPQAEWVFLTASSLANKTFPRLVELCRDANVVLMGPSVPWLLELAEFGIDYLAGVQVVDPVALRRTVAEGGGTRIFDTALRYYIVDLGAKEMGWLQSAIADLVARREHLKRDMQHWYEAHPRERFPRWPELEQIDYELSDLDRRFKRLWDARSGIPCQRDGVAVA